MHGRRAQCAVPGGDRRASDLAPRMFITPAHVVVRSLWRYADAASLASCVWRGATVRTHQRATAHSECIALGGGQLATRIGVGGTARQVGHCANTFEPHTHMQLRAACAPQVLPGRCDGPAEHCVRGCANYYVPHGLLSMHCARLCLWRVVFGGVRCGHTPRSC